MSRNVEPYEMTLIRKDQGALQSEINCNTYSMDLNAVAVAPSSLMKMNKEQAKSEGIYASQNSKAQAMPSLQDDLGLTLSPGLQTRKQCETPNGAPFKNCQAVTSHTLGDKGREAVLNDIDEFVKSRIHFGTKVRYWRKPKGGSATNYHRQATKKSPIVKVKSTDHHLLRHTPSGSLRPQPLTPLIPTYPLSTGPASANPMILQSLNICRHPENQTAGSPLGHSDSLQLCAKERIAIVALNRRVSDLLFVATKQQSELLIERRAREESTERWNKLHRDYNQLYQRYFVLNEAHQNCVAYTSNSTVAQSPASDFTTVFGQKFPDQLGIPLIDLTTPDVNQAVEAGSRSVMPGQGKSPMEHGFQRPMNESLADREAQQSILVAKGRTLVNATEINHNVAGLQHHLSNVEHPASLDDGTGLRSQLSPDIENLDWFEEAMFQE